jgi:ATP synthase protein I
MESLQTIHRRVVFLTAGLLAILLVIWFIAPQKRLVAGLILGISVSLYNTLYMARKVHSVGVRAAETGSVKQRGTGMIHRYLMASLAIIIAALHPDRFDVRIVPLGLPICYIMIYLLEFWQVKCKPTPSGKG